MYGIDNLRGGSYKSIKLDKEIIEYLKQICNDLNTKCYICSKCGHFAKHCNEYNYWDSDSGSDSDSGIYNNEPECIKPNFYKCLYRCFFGNNKIHNIKNVF
jgi:hypothetical protein